MGQQQAQFFCNQCQQPRLHTRITYDVPHVLHLLLTLFCCGMWFPVWMLHILLNSISSAPFLCAHCGHRAERRMPAAIESMAATAASQSQPTNHRARTAGQIAGQGARRAGEWLTISGPKIWEQLKLVARELWGQFKQLPGDIDALLKITAGEGNDLVHMFLRVLILVVSMIAILFGLWFAAGFYFASSPP